MKRCNTIDVIRTWYYPLVLNKCLYQLIHNLNLKINNAFHLRHIHQLVFFMLELCLKNIRLLMMLNKRSRKITSGFTLLRFGRFKFTNFDVVFWENKGPSSLDSLYTYKAKLFRNTHCDFTFATLAHVQGIKLGNPKEMWCF